VLAESILKGNLTDLWSKYLSTLQPNRRASTDLKIVSILKERMQSLDSDDSDDMLEYFMDMEGVDAAAAELTLSARASAGLPQRRPSLSGTTSSTASPALSSRRRTLARSNEERTTQAATTTTAAAKEEKNTEKEKEKENNDDEEKGIEKEEGNIDKGQQQQQRETRERIQG
jgi:hypothetical protein